MNSTIDFETAESWDEAMQIGNLIRDIPSTFATTIRLLKSSGDKPVSELSSTAMFDLYRLIRSDTFTASLFYAATFFRDERLKKLGGINRRNLLLSFSPDELCVLIMLIYLFRRIRAGCDAGLWKDLEASIFKHSTLGAIVGLAIPSIGLPLGLLTGSMRHLGIGMFLGISKESYVQYKKNLRASKKQFDFIEEMNTWGCTHAQIASVLMQPFGLGVELSQTLARGLIPGAEASGITKKSITAVQTTWNWIISLEKTGQPPNIKHSVEYYPHANDLELLLSRTQIALSDPVRCQWLGSSKKSISPETTPDLFQPEIGISAGYEPREPDIEALDNLEGEDS